jgi:hypothetical protein
LSHADGFKSSLHSVTSMPRSFCGLCPSNFLRLQFLKILRRLARRRNWFQATSVMKHETAVA